MQLYFIFAGIVLLATLVFVVFAIVKGVKQWEKNNKSPILTVNATVVAKRTKVSTDSTYYFITYQVESGDRLEFSVRGNEYGQICEGDNGKLTFQGTRYLGFERGFVSI